MNLSDLIFWRNFLVSIWLKGSLFPYRAVFWMWCSIDDVLCHLLYVCVSSDSCKHWDGSAQHFLRILLYLGGYILVTIGKVGEVSLEQNFNANVVSIIWTFWMWYKFLCGVIQCNFLDLISHHFLLLCYICFSKFYASSYVHKDFHFVWISLCVSELYFGLDMMHHLWYLMPFALYVCGHW